LVLGKSILIFSDEEIFDSMLIRNQTIDDFTIQEGLNIQSNFNLINNYNNYNLNDNGFLKRKNASSSPFDALLKPDNAEINKNDENEYINTFNYSFRNYKADFEVECNQITKEIFPDLFELSNVNF
jgi:hypothetical protein